LNPVRIRSHQGKPIKEKIGALEKYRWSRFPGYVDTKKKQSWVSYDSVLGQIGESRKQYREFVVEGMRTGYATPWESVKGQVVLGEEDFIERVKGRIDKRGSKREQPLIRHFEAKTLAQVLTEVARHFGVDEERLSGKRTSCRDERALAMELMYRHGAVGQAEIGKALGGLDYTAVSRERKRLRQRIKTDKTMKMALVNIQRKLMS